MRTAILTIKQEHQSIAAVLHGLRYLVDEVRAGRSQPDFTVLFAMLRYIQEFPDRLHHPQEEEYLFRFLRQRDPASGALLDELEQEHRKNELVRDELVRALASYHGGSAAGLETFSDVLEQYTALQWVHMRTEEDRVIPAAERVLTEADWKAIGDAFSSNRDPLVGIEVAREYRELFRRIVNLAPPPIGVGPPAASGPAGNA